MPKLVRFTLALQLWFPNLLAAHPPPQERKPLITHLESLLSLKKKPKTLPYQWQPSYSLVSKAAIFQHPHSGRGVSPTGETRLPNTAFPALLLPDSPPITPTFLEVLSVMLSWIYCFNTTTTTRALAAFHQCSHCPPSIKLSSQVLLPLGLRCYLEANLEGPHLSEIIMYLSIWLTSLSMKNV